MSPGAKRGCLGCAVQFGWNVLATQSTEGVGVEHHGAVCGRPASGRGRLRHRERGFWRLHRASEMGAMVGSFRSHLAHLTPRATAQMWQAVGDAAFAVFPQRLGARTLRFAPWGHFQRRRSEGVTPEKCSRAPSTDFYHSATSLVRKSSPRLTLHRDL